MAFWIKRKLNGGGWGRGGIMVYRQNKIVVEIELFGAQVPEINK